MTANKPEGALKKKVTVVEDDPDILLTIKILMKEAGYTVAALSSGKAIVEGDYDRPDLFILDKRLPDMDGLEICQVLRSRPESADIPIIMISASPKFGADALRAGANAFLAKPFDINDLLQTVASYLTSSKHVSQ